MKVRVWYAGLRVLAMETELWDAISCRCEAFALESHCPDLLVLQSKLQVSAQNNAYHIACMAWGVGPI